MAASSSIAPLTISRGKSYADGLLTNLNVLQKSSTLTDFTIKVADLSIHVHRCVVASACGYFRTMLASGMKEAREGVVHLDSMDQEVVQAVVDYLYGNEVAIKWDDNRIKCYLDVAESFELPELKYEIEAYIVTNLTLENCIEWYGFADRYHLEKLRIKSRKVLRSNFVKASMSAAFETLSLSEVKELISDEEIASQSGDSILNTCIYWILADEPNRKGSFGELINLIHIDTCSTGYLNFVLETYTKSLITDVEVYAKITQAIIASMKLKDVKTKEPVQNDITNQDRTGKPEEDDKNSIIALGGQTSIMSPNRNVYKIDFTRGTVQEIVTLPETLVRFFPARCVTSRGVFSAGGGTECLPSTATRNCTLFEADTGKTISLPPLSSPAYAMGAVAITESKVYVMGGFGREDQTHVLDLTPAGSPPQPLSWTMCARMKLKVQCPIPCAIGHEIFVLSNTAAQEEISMQCYDTRNNVWGVRAPPPLSVTNTNGACAVAIEFDIFIVGGDGRLCLRYSTMEDRWATLSRPIADHGYGSAVHRNGKILLCGGRDRGQYSSVVEAYDIPSDTWEICAPNLPLQLLDLSVFLSDYLEVPRMQDDEDVWVLVKGEDEQLEELGGQTSEDKIRCEVVG